MKLSSGQIEQTVRQFPARPIPDNHPAATQLEQLFGEHTFFLDPDGLHIVEVAGSAADNGRETCKVVKLASWHDENRTSLAPHAPEEIDVLIELDSAA